MPRKSPYAINLSREERRALEAMARRYTSPYCDVVRAKIVLLADEGLSNDVIASRLDMPRQIVSKWRKRFALARLPGHEPQPPSRHKARSAPQPSRSGYVTGLRAWDSPPLFNEYVTVILDSSSTLTYYFPGIKGRQPAKPRAQPLC